jgi:hypothetical protein
MDTGFQLWPAHLRWHQPAHLCTMRIGTSSEPTNSLPNQWSTSMMAAPVADRVWLNPQKFWAATKGMSEEEIEHLLADLMYLAEARDFNALQRFDYILIGMPTVKVA